jgi:signal transduction histidine kinase
VVTFTGKGVDSSERFRWEDLIHPNDLDSTTNAWVAAINAGVPLHIKLRLRGADGIYRWFQVSAAPIRDESGKIVHWFGLHIDIDDNVRITEELRQTQARLSRATQIAAVAELSASIAHEINQPLAAAVANGHACQRWLLAAPPNIERARLTAARMIRDANTVAEVVRKIRSLYKETAPNLAPLDINDLILAVVRLTTEELQELGIGLETDLATGLPTVQADRVQIQQALINLLHNAIEAMEGIVERPRVLGVSSQLESGDLLVRIRDTGCGITQPTLIFDPFFTTKESGMGMGLSICRSIVESHGGHLWATPNDGAGTTFSFTLPVHRELSA